ncbi:hypothetical protein B0H13DRAFT_1898809 [Mycena leptocephala]|nr:hypothetical protein B0H13DRAFT_1898809 [Mycena leptocephala]
MSQLSNSLHADFPRAKEFHHNLPPPERHTRMPQTISHPHAPKLIATNIHDAQGVPPILCAGILMTFEALDGARRFGVALVPDETNDLLSFLSFHKDPLTYAAETKKFLLHERASPGYVSYLLAILGRSGNATHISCGLRRNTPPSQKPRVTRDSTLEGRPRGKYGLSSHPPLRKGQSRREVNSKAWRKTAITYELRVEQNQRQVSGKAWRKKATTYFLWAGQSRREVSGEAWRKTAITYELEMMLVGIKREILCEDIGNFGWAEFETLLASYHDDVAPFPPWSPATAPSPQPSIPAAIHIHDIHYIRL